MTTHPWRRIAVATTAAGLLLPIATAWAAPTPGASGIGDPYYPEYGNGGYDVGHYDIAVQYDRATDTLSGTTTLTATATQDLSTFDLDFVLTASSVAVNGTAAQWSGAAGADRLFPGAGLGTASRAAGLLPRRLLAGAV